MVSQSSKHVNFNHMNSLRHLFEWALSAFIQVFIGVFVYIKILTGLLLADMVLGILSAFLQQQPISVKKMLPTLIKILTIVVLLPAFFHYETVFNLSENHQATALLASIIGAVQMFSMDKHFLVIFGFSFWSILTDRFPKLDTLLKPRNGSDSNQNNPAA